MKPLVILLIIVFVINMTFVSQIAYCGSHFTKTGNIILNIEKTKNTGLIHYMDFCLKETNNSAFKCRFFFHKLDSKFFTEIEFENGVNIFADNINPKHFYTAYSHVICSVVLDNDSLIDYLKNLKLSVSSSEFNSINEELNNVIISFILTKNGITEFFLKNNEKIILDNIKISDSLFNGSSGPQFLSKIAQVMETEDLINLLKNYNNETYIKNFLDYNPEVHKIISELANNPYLAMFFEKAILDYVSYAISNLNPVKSLIGNSFIETKLNLNENTNNFYSINEFDYSKYSEFANTTNTTEYLKKSLKPQKIVKSFVNSEAINSIKINTTGKLPWWIKEEKNKIKLYNDFIKDIRKF